jgi:hypothetical protein
MSVFFISFYMLLINSGNKEFYLFNGRKIFFIIDVLPTQIDSFGSGPSSETTSLDISSAGVQSTGSF